MAHLGALGAKIIIAGKKRAINRNEMKDRKKKKRRRTNDEGAYICPTCGERIIIPLDRTGGADQEYVEDCPVCCNPNVIHVEFFDEPETARVWAERE